MFRRAGLASIATAFLLATLAAGPATNPSTQPSDIAQWLEAAASPEPEDREAARIKLLGLTPDDLPTLHQVAKTLVPLKPAQVDVFRQTVIHIRTRQAMMQQPSSGRAVMGVMLSPFDMIAVAGGPEEKPAVGVEVICRLPGFVAARYLRDADVITGFEVDGQTHWFESRQQLQPFVAQLPVGKMVTVLVRRCGQDLKFQFPLDLGRSAENDIAPDPGRGLQALADKAEAEAAQQLEQEFGDVLGLDVD